MTPEQFCYWLKSAFDLGLPPPDAKQWEVINRHLSLVFHQVAPTVGEVTMQGEGVPSHALSPLDFQRMQGRRATSGSALLC